MKLKSLVIVISLSLITVGQVIGQSKPEILNQEGNKLARQGQLRPSLTFYNQAIKLDPKYAEPYYNRGKAELSLKDYTAAIRDFNLAIKLDPKSADAYNNRGIAKKKGGDTKGAMADYNIALRYNPRLYGAYLNRGIARYEMGDTAGARSDFTIASKHNVPQAVEALKQLADS